MTHLRRKVGTRTSHKLANELTLEKHFVDRAKALSEMLEVEHKALRLGKKSNPVVVKTF